MEGLREAEEKILQCLGSGHRLLYNLAATKKLASIQKLHEEIVEGLVFWLPKKELRLCRYSGQRERNSKKISSNVVADSGQCAKLYPASSQASNLN